MEIDASQLGLAQLHQAYGELTIQIKFLSQKANQVEALIVQKANELQKAEILKQQQLQEVFKNGCKGTAAPHLQAVPTACNETGPSCCVNEQAVNGLSPEAS